MTDGGAVEGSDEQLLTQARAGAMDALAVLLKRHGPQVRATLHINPKWRSVLEVDDIMQVTYFDAVHCLDQFTSDAGAFPIWLRRVAENNLRSAIESLEREKRPRPDDRLQPPRDANPVEWLGELVTGTGTTPSRVAARDELRRILEAEMDKLPADYGRALRLIYFAGKSVADAAEALGRTRGAVYLLRNRALDRLRQSLGAGSRFFSSWA